MGSSGSKVGSGVNASQSGPPIGMSAPPFSMSGACGRALRGVAHAAGDQGHRVAPSETPTAGDLLRPDQDLMPWTRLCPRWLPYASMVAACWAPMHPAAARPMAQPLSVRGIDRATWVLHVVGMPARRAVGLRKRRARGALLPVIAQLPPLRI